MENAAHALIIAGSVLIGLLIIGALVFTYREITDSEGSKQEQIRIQQIDEFNKQYTSFEKKLYGSELLSLINKAIDYDNKIDAEQSGYTKMSIFVTVSRQTDFINAGNYTINNEQNQNLFTSKLAKIEQIKNTYGGDQYLQRLVALYNGGSTKEEDLKDLLEEIGIDISSPSKLDKVKEDLKTYYGYIEFKRKQFKHIETKYDENGNGRIVSMSYEEIN